MTGRVAVISICLSSSVPRSPARAELSTAPGTRRWTLRDALSRAVHVLTEEGVRAVIARAAGEAVYRRLRVLERGLDEQVDVDVPAGLEFGYLDESGLEEYERLRPGHRARAAARLAAGDRCFATWSDGRLVAACWLATGAPQVEYLDVRLELGDGEVYHYDMFTGPATRRRGISLASQTRLFETLRSEGYRASIRAVLPENAAAVADAASAGYRPAGRIGYVQLGRWRRPFARGARRVARS